MRIANWRKLWGSVNWETVENCWELWKLVRIVGTCRVGWIKKRKQWSIYFQPLRVHTGRFFFFFLQLPWTSISMSLCLFVEVRPDAWEILEISAISASYSHIRVVRTIWIRTHTDTRRYTGTYAHICTYEVHIRNPPPLVWMRLICRSMELKWQNGFLAVLHIWLMTVLVFVRLSKYVFLCCLYLVFGRRAVQSDLTGRSNQR